MGTFLLLLSQELRLGQREKAPRYVMHIPPVASVSSNGNRMCCRNLISSPWPRRDLPITRNTARNHLFSPSFSYFKICASEYSFLESMRQVKDYTRRPATVCEVEKTCCVFFPTLFALLLLVEVKSNGTPIDALGLFQDR